MLLSGPAPRSMGRREGAAVTLVTRRRSNDRLAIEIDDRTAADGFDESSWSGDLAACQQIVEAHGGTLEVELSTVRESRFQLELPITAGGAGVLVPG